MSRQTSFARGSCARPLVDKQIPEQAKEFGIAEEQVVKTIMLKETVDGEFTTTYGMADAVLYSHGWFMQ